MKARKYYHEPMHTAEHILNQTMVRMFKCERSLVSVLSEKKQEEYLMSL